MIAINNERSETTWQSAFIAMLPEIEQKLRLAFCRLDPEAREDAIEEGIVHSLLTYVRLDEQGRAEVATPSSLAWYSSRLVKRGRPAAGRMIGKEPLSRYGQISNDIEVEHSPVIGLTHWSKINGRLSLIRWPQSWMWALGLQH